MKRTICLQSSVIITNLIGVRESCYVSLFECEKKVTQTGIMHVQVNSSQIRLLLSGNICLVSKIQEYVNFGPVNHFFCKM